MRKNILIILVINLLLFLILIVGLEAYTYKETIDANVNSINNFNKLLKKEKRTYRSEIKYKSPKKFEYTKIKKSFRPVNYVKSNKKPVVLFGCSFIQGTGLENNQTLAYKISKLSNRTTYNRARYSTGPQFMYYQLNDKAFKQEVPDAEYIIYTFIGVHLPRLYDYQTCPFSTEINLRYKIFDNKLVEIKPAFMPFYSLYMVKKIQSKLVAPKISKEEANYNLFNCIMKESIDIAKKKYPNSKFVILEYPDGANKKLSQDEILKLEYMGFVFVNVEKLIGHNLNDSKYKVADNYHPSEAAWNEITPKLVQKLKL